ncbi:TlpA family protein disulfide reductase [Flavobacterium sp. P4023]|uniref:TlpA family protein disulfide reductase n=1 Tax=Flavobacterium flabelliforme TaxID=2816119 RepID=A0ABS5CVF1_9FLAO|nr:TlpA disulfide reductase family protein [Flavobacterium flabelliforme]MBP4142584.1 TlpA family protein disulfide reductase [Flavobacterium flabelliforme]
MKNVFLIALLVVLLSCQKVMPPKDYVVLHGKIENPTEGLGLRFYNPVTSKSFTVKVDANGTYRDTIKLEKAAYYNAVYGNVFGAYLANDMDLEINFDGKSVSKSVSFKGKGENENNFLKFKTKSEGALIGADYRAFLNLKKPEFDAKMKKFTDDFKAEIAQKKSVLEPSFVTTQLKNLDEFNKSMTQQFVEELRNNSELGAGKQSPDFKNYINHDGGKTSLSDFRGSYVFIDVWATWCGPCKYEFPFIGKVEKMYHGKNIKFVSISIDRLKDEQKWRDMIKKEGLVGIQLLADKEINSSFIAGYYIQAIPRFIILDKEGKIINSDSPRPSEPELLDILNSLDL